MALPSSLAEIFQEELPQLRPGDQQLLPVLRLPCFIIHFLGEGADIDHLECLVTIVKLAHLAGVVAHAPEDVDFLLDALEIVLQVEELHQRERLDQQAQEDDQVVGIQQDLRCFHRLQRLPQQPQCIVRLQRRCR